MKYLITSFIICNIIFLSCSSNKNPYENNLGIEPVTIAQMDTANYTQILWEDSVINIGTINAVDTAAITINFRFKNVGDKPLFVISVGASCGCTIASYSKEPLFPGKESVINAIYKQNGETGTVRKTIFVKTNTKNRSSHTLVFYGEVVKILLKKNNLTQLPAHN